VRTTDRKTHRLTSWERKRKRKRKREEDNRREEETSIKRSQQNYQNKERKRENKRREEKRSEIGYLTVFGSSLFSVSLIVPCTSQDDEAEAEPEAQVEAALSNVPMTLKQTLGLDPDSKTGI
jgi:hypothetical protein